MKEKEEELEHMEALQQALVAEECKGKEDGGHEQEKEEKKREEMKRKRKEQKREKGNQRMAPVNEERKKQGHLVPTSILTLSTLEPY